MEQMSTSNEQIKRITEQADRSNERVNRKIEQALDFQRWSMMGVVISLIGFVFVVIFFLLVLRQIYEDMMESKGHRGKW